MESTPEEIFKNLRNNSINKITAYNLLKSLIEDSDNETQRLESIKYIKKIGVIDEKLFNFFENLLISDSNSMIRSAAAKIITINFQEKAINPLMWALKNEQDYKCLITVITSLKKIDTQNSKLVLLDEIKKILKTKYLNKEKNIDNKKYKKVIKKLLKTKKLNSFTQEQLADILTDYITIKHLIKQYPNVFYELNSINGLIREIDLSDYMEYEVKGTPWGWKNNIENLSNISGLFNLKKLEKLDLSNNLISNIKKINQLKELTHLILRNNKISEIENLNYVNKLPHLEFLDLRGNEISKKVDINKFDPKTRVLLKYYLLD